MSGDVEIRCEVMLDTSFGVPPNPDDHPVEFNRYAESIGNAVAMLLLESNIVTVTRVSAYTCGGM